MQRVPKELRVVGEAGQTPTDPHALVALQMRPLQKGVHVQVQAGQAHAHPLGQQAVRLFGVREDVPSEGPSEEPFQGAQPVQGGVRVRQAQLQEGVHVGVELQETSGHTRSGRGESHLSGSCFVPFRVL